jgi:hypothetical protein
MLETPASCVVDHCLDELSDLDREVVVSYFFVQAAKEQAASRIGLSPSAMSRQLRRALTTLRRKLRTRGLVVPGMLSTFFADLNAQSRIPDNLAEQLATIDPAAAQETRASASRCIAPRSGVKRVVFAAMRWCGRCVGRPSGRSGIRRNIGRDLVQEEGNA